MIMAATIRTMTLGCEMMSTDLHNALHRDDDLVDTRIFLLENPDRSYRDDSGSSSKLFSWVTAGASFRMLLTIVELG
jgi:hypothetical protein